MSKTTSKTERPLSQPSWRATAHEKLLAASPNRV